MLSFSQFTLQSVSFEIRYEYAFLLWDNSGQIWESAKQRWPDIQIRSAEPNKTVFYRENRYQFQIGIDRASFVATKPHSSLKEFIEIVECFETLIRDKLELSFYNRIGFRPTFIKKYPNREDASKEFLESIALPIPKEAPFKVGREPILPAFSLRWESDATGATMRMKADGKRIDFDPPIEASEIEDLKPLHYEINGIYFDIDYYTIAPVSTNQFNTRTWIDNAYRVIKRDSEMFFRS